MSWILDHCLKYFPNNLNVAVQDADDKQLSYAQLWEQALQVQSHVINHYNEQEIIALALNNDLSSYPLILGTWLAGKAYLPIPDDFPKERRNFLLQQTGNLEVVKWENIEDSSVSQPQSVKAFKGQLAYVLYTSGSTGLPKGVPISFDNLEAFCVHYTQHPEIQWKKGMRFLQSYDLSFDVSVKMYLLSWLSLGTLFLLPKKGIKFTAIAQSLLKNKIEVCSNVPSTAKLLMPYQNELSLDSLKYCFFSGDALYPNWAKAWMKMAPNALVYNCYGPTETCIVCSEILLNNLDPTYFKEKAPLPIGKAFDFTDYQIVNKELAIGGKQVFKGYLGIVQNVHWITLNNQKYFLSGDLVQKDAKGNLIFKGRKDNQVQIMGYRVDLDEIKNLILHHLGLLSEAFLIQDQVHLIVEGDEFIYNDKIKTLLKQHLPDYMQVKAIKFLKKFPLNRNQKVNTKELRNIFNEA